MIITMVVVYFLLSWMSSSSSSITDNGDNDDEDEDIYSDSQCKQFFQVSNINRWRFKDWRQSNTKRRVKCSIWFKKKNPSSINVRI